MKLLVVVVQDEDANGLIDGLMQERFRATRLSATGGFLRETSAVILLAVPEERIEAALAVIERNCKTRLKRIRPTSPLIDDNSVFEPSPIEIQVGGAHVIQLDIERVVRL